MSYANKLIKISSFCGAELDVGVAEMVWRNVCHLFGIAVALRRSPFRRRTRKKTKAKPRIYPTMTINDETIWLEKCLTDRLRSGRLIIHYAYAGMANSSRLCRPIPLVCHVTRYTIYSVGIIH